MTMGVTMVTGRRVLLVTARPEARAALAAALTAAGFRMDVEAPTVALIDDDVFDREPPPDVVVLDTSGVPGELAWRLAGALAVGRVIALVENADDLRRAFEAGVEDCVNVAAHPDEVGARLEAVLRRTDRMPAAASDSSIYVDRRLWVNHDTRQVWVRGEPANLTPREFRLLTFLISHGGGTQTHEEILSAVWGRAPEKHRPTEVLKQYIWRLRQKVEADPEQPEIVVTVPGAGYRFAVDNAAPKE